MRRTVVAPDAKLPKTAESTAGSKETSRGVTPKPGHLAVSEIVSDRAAAPSPFGDDQTFPLPIEELTYVATTAS
jgi:hypothetical protein